MGYNFSGMNKLIKVLGVFVFLAGVMTSCASGPKVSTGSVVQVEYTGVTKADGKEFDSNVGKKPLVFLVGANQVLPAFEKAVTGLAKGAKKKFTLKSSEAYGEADESKVVTLPKDTRFKGVALEEGKFITANQKDPSGKSVQFPIKVVKVTEEEVTLDYNHPLAGKDLVYEVKILEVQTPEELAEAQKAPAAATEAPAATKQAS